MSTRVNFITSSFILPGILNSQFPGEKISEKNKNYNCSKKLILLHKEIKKEDFYCSIFEQNENSVECRLLIVTLTDIKSGKE